jgi:predicted O-methyltransferase YrrM
VTDDIGTPDRVRRAYATARRIGFPVTPGDPGRGRGSACRPGTGRFLAMLAAGCHGGLIGELGTGAGIGTAWMSDAMPADCALVTAEIDAGRAAAARELLADDPRIEVLTGDAVQLISARGPYDLIFADCAVRDAATFGAVVGLLRPGGRIVMDDVTPMEALPADSPFREHDVKRELFAADARLTWTEIVLPDLASSLLAGTRR